MGYECLDLTPIFNFKKVVWTPPYNAVWVQQLKGSLETHVRQQVHPQSCYGNDHWDVKALVQKNLLANLMFSKQPETCLEGASSRKYQWRLVDDFITEFNKHWCACFHLAEMITIDKSMIQWYGIGRHWINAGLPNCVAINRKPENSCKIQNGCCRRMGIMMARHLVRGPVEEALELDDDDN
jgi:hypothetical protein